MIGKKIRNYQIEELIGEGGMGVVYRAKDISLNRNVAIKMLHQEMLHNPDLLKRFKNEAHVTARLSHPNIATLYNFFTDGDLHCLVMEYVNGRTLEDILAVHKTLPYEECVRMLIQLLEGLEEAHSNGILHRDIKPGNIMVNHAGYVKLMDFGVARFENSARMTRMNRVIGTLEYMAPELLTGGRPSLQADLYSAGVVAFEMYTGRLPFEAGDDADMTQKILRGTYSFNDKRGIPIPGTGTKLERIIQKLMHKNACRRYKDTREVLTALRELKVSGRMSPFLLGNSQLPVQEENPLGIQAAWKDYLYQVQKNLKETQQELQPVVTKFLQMTEGKIIFAAIGIALLIILISFAFSGNSEHENPADPAGLPSEQILSLNQDAIESRLLQNTGPEESSVQGNTVGQGRTRSPQLPDPEPIVRERTTSRNSSSGNTGETGISGETENSQRSPGGGSESNQAAGSESSQNTAGNGSQVADTDHEEVVDNKSERSREVSERDRASERRTIDVSVSNELVVGMFTTSISTNTHNVGDRFYLTVAGPVYANGYKVIDSGARVSGVVTNIRTRGATRRATLAVAFEAVEAVDGTWLPVSYPEYSNQATGSVTFPRGTTISRLRIESGTVSIEID